ncbi:MAG: ATP-binding protein [bacterium]
MKIKNVIFAFVLACLIIVGVGSFSFYSLFKYNEEIELIEHTYLVMQRLEEFISDIKDVERAVRGYVISGDSVYIQPYYNVINKYNNNKSYITSLLKDEYVKNQFKIIDSLCKNKVDLNNKLIEFTKAGNQLAVNEIFQKKIGYLVMKNINNISHNIYHREQVLLSERKKDAKNRGLITYVTIVIGSTGSLFIFLFVFNILKKEVRNRTEAELHLAKVNDELNSFNLKLEAANKELEAFSYSVSHDLRAPLRHIDGFSELLVSYAKNQLDAKASRYVEKIAKSAKIMGKLIDDLLTFSRMGRIDMRKVKVDMGILIKNQIETLSRDISDRSIEWTIPKFPYVLGDPDMLGLVWQNLISNSLKYTRNKDTAKIEIGCIEKNNNVTFFIKDNGVGFDMEYYDKLFNVFQRLHSASDFEGTGVGLANVKRIISRHEGKIRAEGVPNQGATFYFTLPKLIERN